MAAPVTLAGKRWPVARLRTGAAGKRLGGVAQAGCGYALLGAECIRNGKGIMIEDILDEAKGKMESTLSVFRDELSRMRSGRASTALVDRMMVDYYGQDTELRQIASISTPEAMLILIRPYDKAAVRNIEKAIQMSDIGVNPNVDGENIRLNMPALTRERRAELVKFLNRRMEDTRVAIRNIRRSANSDLQDFEKEKLISEDDRKRGEVDVQKLTDKYIDQIGELGAAKETDIMEV